MQDPQRDFLSIKHFGVRENIDLITDLNKFELEKLQHNLVTIFKINIIIPISK